MNQIWILDDDESIRWVLERAFSQQDWQVKTFARPGDFSEALKQEQPDVVLTDIRMPEQDGMSVLAQLQEERPDLPVLVMTAHSDLESAVNAYKGGAFEYLPKPFDLDEVLEVAARAVKQKPAPTEPREARPDTGIIGDSPAMQEVFRAIGRLSRSEASVLLTGASGTGKELVARALHEHSDRAGKPFIALNMAAIPQELIESELFGHAKGAFTGAVQQREGRFRQADGGTLFLDEIGDMPLAVQTRLLRVLAEGQFYPVGSHQLVSVNVRIVAATHQDLQQAVEQGEFREDLYHRLHVIHLRLPDLRERQSDIPALARHFLALAAAEMQVPVKRLTPEAEQALCRAPWPGHVRQLENVCRWITVMASSELVDTDELPPEVSSGPAAAGEHPPVTAQTGLAPGSSHAEAAGQSTARQLAGEAAPVASVLQPLLQQALQEGRLPEFLARVEELAIAEALHYCDGKKQAAARQLGWGRNTLTRKLQRRSSGSH